MSVPYLYRDLPDRHTGIRYAWFTAMHTRVDIILSGKAEKELEDAAGLIKDELARLEKTVNFFDAGSELYALNRVAANQPTTVSEELYGLIDMELRYRPMTMGCFDVTIQSDGYGPETWRSVDLSPRDRTVRFKRSGTRIDLSGFIKGYALEEIRKILAGSGIQDALINLGNSSVLAIGNHPYGQGWKIKMNNKSGAEVCLQNNCLTTSGNDTPERRHIVSPSTGKYAEGAGQVSVVTPNGAEGEALSTALFVASPGQRAEMLKAFAHGEVYIS